MTCRVSQMGLTCGGGGGGDNSGKMAKTAWKLQNQHFGGKTIRGGGHGEQFKFSGSGGIFTLICV